MKNIFTFYFTILCFVPMFSQVSEIEDELKILYADEKYVKCVRKAEKYTQSKKHKSDPIPYVYASMALLRMSQDYDLRTEFPKSFKESLKYASRYRKKDKSGQYYATFQNHFDELKTIVYEELDNINLLYYEKEDKVKGAKKSLYFVKKLNEMDPNDQGLWLLRAYYENMRKNTIEGKATIREHEPLLEQLAFDKQGSFKPKKSKVTYYVRLFNDMSKIEQKYLQRGLLQYAEYLQNKNKFEDAKTILDYGKPFFYEEVDASQLEYSTKYKKAYDELANS